MTDTMTTEDRETRQEARRRERAERETATAAEKARAAKAAILQFAEAWNRLCELERHSGDAADLVFGADPVRALVSLAGDHSSLMLPKDRDPRAHTVDVAELRKRLDKATEENRLDYVAGLVQRMQSEIPRPAPRRTL